jgi:uncharacterized protein (DUF736 family)
MAWEHKEGSGALFKNGKKEKDSHPDYRGDAMVNGTLMEIAAWIKEGKNGGKFMSLSIKPKEEREAPAPEKKAPSKFDALEDDLPFN